MKLGKRACAKTFHRWRLSPLALTVGSCLFSGNVIAEEYFNPAFLTDGRGRVADLSGFEDGNVQAAGVYRVDIFLNNDFISSHDVDFRSLRSVGAQETSDDGTGLVACLSPKSLTDMGMELNLPEEKKQSESGQCTDISSLIEGAKASFDFAHQRLDLSVPQVALKNVARGYIPPEKWDEGISALLMNYTFTGSSSKDNGSSNNSQFLGLNGGINAGPWRLRDYSTFSRNTNSGTAASQWDHVSSFIERAIIPLKGELTIGDSYTTGDVFDSVSFRGVQIASDDNMLPDSLKGFAPTVRGIAKSNAQVTIKQNNYVLYQTYVAPGAFAIDDLFPTSSSGDLTVEIKEKDGSLTTYTVPYSAVPLLQREGRIKYALTVANYRTSNDQQEQSPFGQGTIIWGAPHGLTLYGGTQISQRYRSQAVGAGINMGGWGAVSADITHAKSMLIDDSQHSGHSLRLLYAKSLNDLGTNFQLLGYRYSTSGYYTFEDTTYQSMSGYKNDPEESEDNDRPRWFDYYNLYYTKRGKIQVNISQQLGKTGSMYLNGSQQTYWHTDSKDTLVQLGYNTTWHDINIGVSYSYSKTYGQPEADKVMALNVSLPLNKWLTPEGTARRNSTYATMSMSKDNHGSVTQNAGISGTLLEGNNLTYSVQQGYVNQGSGYSGSVGLSHQGGYGNSNMGYNVSGKGESRQLTYGIAGGVVAHRHGITFSQPLGDTNVLIEAPGAKQVKIQNATGVSTDWRGYAVVPFATTYRKNRIALDTTTLSDKVDLDGAVVDVVPTKGALVSASFKARVGIRALLTLKHNDIAIPFGSTVSRDDDGSAGIAGDGGQVYLSGLATKGTLSARWGDGADQRCSVNYQLPESAENAVVMQLTLNCR